MAYYIFTLKFLTPVHFGDAANGGFLDKIAMSCSADTLFAALCNEAALQGEAVVQQFVEKVSEKKIAFSSLMPYFRTEDEDIHFYLPKPLLTNEVNKQASKSFQEMKQLATKLKKQKKTSFIRASQIPQLLQSRKNGVAPELQVDEFAVPFVSGRVNLRDEKPQPYYVGSYVFADNAGLYLLCSVEDDTDVDFVENLLISLGASGIGGKRSSGYGKFALADDRWELCDDGGIYDDDSAIALMLFATDSSLQMCVAPLCPQQEDVLSVKAGAYRLVKRGGFISSPELGENVKRDSIYMLAEGSCFSKRLEGRMLEQSIAGLSHRVYRNGLGMFLGLRDD
ncbi:type III-A CRISPR-associated RAMP protein Csm4 [Phascolarctobacterium sp.]